MEDHRVRIGQLLKKNSVAIDDLLKRMIAIEEYIRTDERQQDLPLVIVTDVLKSQFNQDVPEPDDLIFVDDVLRQRIEKIEDIVYNRTECEYVDLSDNPEIPEYISTKNKSQPEDVEFLDQLLDKLTSIREQSEMLHFELQSIEQADRAEVSDDDDISICTENTEACQELIDKNPNVVLLNCDSCKSCMKDKAKQIKREKKAKEKERRAYLRQLKNNEREVLAIEQRELQNKLSEFRSQIDKISEISEQQKIELGIGNKI